MESLSPFSFEVFEILRFICHDKSNIFEDIFRLIKLSIRNNKDIRIRGILKKVRTTLKSSVLRYFIQSVLH